jgi:hypothetical protein
MEILVGNVMVDAGNDFGFDRDESLDDNVVNLILDVFRVLSF